MRLSLTTEHWWVRGRGEGEVASHEGVEEVVDEQKHLLCHCAAGPPATCCNAGAVTTARRLHGTPRGYGMMPDLCALLENSRR